MIVRGLAIAGFAVASLTAAPCRSATNDFSAKDGQVLGRTLGFVGDGMSGTAMVGIVFAPNDPASQHDAQIVRAVIGNGLTTGRVSLQARLLPIDQLATISGLDALYVTTGLEGRMNPIIGTAQRLHIPTLSADPAYLHSGECVVGFSSEPTVQIVIVRAAADRAGVHFVQAFRMLVKEQ